MCVITSVGESINLGNDYVLANVLAIGALEHIIDFARLDAPIRFVTSCALLENRGGVEIYCVGS